MKRKRPKLVVDNKLPDDDSGVFSYPEFKQIAEQLLDLHTRYPELYAIRKRAYETDDIAMMLVLSNLLTEYGGARDWVAKKKRQNLRVKK